MEKNYKLLTVTELTQMRDIFDQVGNDPQYNAVKKLYAYIVANGAIREDVYKYLLEHMNFMDASINILNNFVKTNAAPEWFELIKKTEDRASESEVSKDNMRLFQQLVVEAYRDEIPYTYIDDALKGARYPYEVSQRIEQYRRDKNHDFANAIDGLRAVMDEVAKDRQTYLDCYGQIAECIEEKDEIIKRLNEEINEIKSAVPALGTEEFVYSEEDAAKDYSESEDLAVEENEAGPTEKVVYEKANNPRKSEQEYSEQQEEKHTDLSELLGEIRRESELRREETNELLAGIKELIQGLFTVKPIDNTESFAQSKSLETQETIESQESASKDKLEQSDKEKESTQEETGSEAVAESATEAPKRSMSTRIEENIIVTKKDAEKELKRVGFFQKIRENKRKIAFEKMTDKKKLEELFLMMNEKNYNEEMIANVRKCLTLGVSFEFLYAFIDMGARDEEFKKLILFRDSSKQQSKQHICDGADNEGGATNEG